MTWNLIFIFTSASLFGWFLEVAYRSLSTKKLTNPGFLNGPYLPIYGSTAILFFIISSLDISIYFKLPILILFPTLVELVTGLFFINIYRIKLWDYSDRFMNFKGIICPTFSFYWTLIALFFYFFIFQFLTNILPIIRTEYIIIITYLAMGIILIDMYHSFSLATKMKKTNS